MLLKVSELIESLLNNMTRVNCSNTDTNNRRCGKQFRVRNRATKLCRKCYKAVHGSSRPIPRMTRTREVYKKPKFEAIAPTGKGKRKK